MSVICEAVVQAAAHRCGVPGQKGTSRLLTIATLVETPGMGPSGVDVRDVHHIEVRNYDRNPFITFGMLEEPFHADDGHRTKDGGAMGGENALL